LLMPLDSQYCKVGSIGYNNLLHVAFDFSFFNGSNAFYLDVWESFIEWNVLFYTKLFLKKLKFLVHFFFFCAQTPERKA